MKTTYKIIKRNYGAELNQVNPKAYTTKEAANEAGLAWENEITSYAGKIEGRNFEVVKVN